MASARSLTLAALAALVLAGSGMMTFAQPAGEPGRGTPAAAPKDQPAGDRPRDGQDGPRPDGMRGQPGGEGRGGQRGGEAGGVKQGMSMMNRSLRTLKNQVSDAAKKDENLKLVNDLQRGCVAAKGVSPDRALGRMEDAKKAEAAAAYRKALIQIMEKALKLETALMDGKTAEASALVDEIVKLRDESHKVMGVKEEREGGRGEGRGGPRGGEGGGPGGPEGPGGR